MGGWVQLVSGDQNFLGIPILRQPGYKVWEPAHPKPQAQIPKIPGGSSLFRGQSREVGPIFDKHKEVLLIHGLEHRKPKYTTPPAIEASSTLGPSPCNRTDILLRTGLGRLRLGLVEF